MIGLDTNVVVRYVMQDDPVQSAQATELVEGLGPESPGFISLVALVELYWVLTHSYGLTGQQVMQAVEAMLRTRQLVLAQADVVLRAVRAFNAQTNRGSGKADFADCLIRELSVSAGCEKTVTFDKSAAKHGGMALLG